MLRNILIIAFVIVGLMYGVNYFLSDRFQNKADKEKIQWTCGPTLVAAEFYVMFSKYDKAMPYLERVPKRCPKSEEEEKALYRMAYCLEEIGQIRKSIRAYRDFSEKYPKSKSAKRAQTRADHLDMHLR